MNNDEVRTVLKYAAYNGNIERYPVPVISDRLKGLLCALIYGAATGFIIGFVVGRMI